MKRAQTGEKRDSDEMQKKRGETEEGVTSLRHHGCEQQTQPSPGVILRERGGEAAK